MSDSNEPMSHDEHWDLIRCGVNIPHLYDKQGYPCLPNRQFYLDAFSGPPSDYQKKCFKLMKIPCPSGMTLKQADDLLISKAVAPSEYEVEPFYRLPSWVKKFASPSYPRDRYAGIYKREALKMLGPDLTGKIDDVKIAASLYATGLKQSYVAVVLCDCSPNLQAYDFGKALSIADKAMKLPSVRKALSKGAER